MARKPKEKEDKDVDVSPVVLEPCRICPYPGDCKRAGRCRNERT